MASDNVMTGTDRAARTCLVCGRIMAPRKKTVEELRREAIAKLERRGYEVRGKTPAQVRQILRRSPKKPSTAGNGPQER
jgi:hypothetical protein